MEDMSKYRNNEQWAKRTKTSKLYHRTWRSQ